MSAPLKVLFSAASLEEACLLVDLGVDIIDVKNPAEGSLGAQPPWLVRSIADYANARRVPVSATLGDLPFKPGTAALAAFGLAHLGVRYVKAGLYGAHTREEAVGLLAYVRDAIEIADETISLVAASYADYRSFGGLPPLELVEAAAAVRCSTVMLDTANKWGGSLFDVMEERELESFITSAHHAEMTVALAGSIAACHMPALIRLQPDIIGVRGALCTGHDRTQQIDSRLAKDFLDVARAHHAVHYPRISLER